MNDEFMRCPWSLASPLDRQYHDQEWGRPVYDDKTLFEGLVLEGAQAGLSWTTILKKRHGYRLAFADFEAGRIAQFNPADIEHLMANPGIVRHRLKIESVIQNARALLKLQQTDGSFSEYLWSFIGGQPRINHWRSMQEVPSQTPESCNMSNDLKKRGFNFVGPTICYAFMQATGMVNDHLVDCFRHPQLR